MLYQIILRPSAGKDLEKSPKKDRTRILAAIAGLARDPFSGKKLEGKHAGSYSLRVWPYRIIYNIRRKELVILVVRIGQRGGVYK